ncbi:MAG: SAM-dependent methyltransferase [Syntrophaceae bacterium]|nr:SAM-dependent methyltransferase [Syntrophaceae bacterium]
MSRHAEPNQIVKTVDHEPSETAMGAAFLRAMSAVDRRIGIRGPDSLAKLFLPESRRIILDDPALRGWVIRNAVSPGMYEFMIARTAFFDDMFKQALAAGVPQIVFLGAGYDSRSCRFRDFLGDVRIFELDMPETQRHKQELLNTAGVPIPEQLTFVPIDFRTGGIGSKLRKAGFDAGRETLFVWEGVTYYLPPRVVGDTLKVIKTSSSAGSSVCFDYASHSIEKLEQDRVMRLRETMKMNYPGEPTCFSLRDGEIEAFLSKRGFRILEHLTSEEMEARYLNLPDRSLAGVIPGVFCFVHAAFPG